MGRETPVLVDLKPTGQHYMEDLYRVGGLTTILREIKPLLNLDALTITGRTLGAEIDAAPATQKQDVVRAFKNPIFKEGGMAVLRGNLAPGGAIVKQSAATAKLMQHEGRAVVFDTLEDLAARIDAPDLDVTADDILVLRNAGPKGAPGMPEAGYIPIPKKLAQKGVKDMVRISGRAHERHRVRLHRAAHHARSPRSAGRSRWCKTGDRIRLDVAKRRLELLVSDAELEARRKKWKAPKARAGDERGYRKLFLDTVQQADRGCDFEFLAPPVIARTPS